MFDALKKLFGIGSSVAAEKNEKRNGSPEGAGNGNPVSLKDLEGFVDYVVRALVDYPDEVHVSTKTENDDKVIWIACRKEDTGKIIGKKGKTIIALRALVAGAAGRMQNRVKVEVAD
ncbi:MAG: KH domain-containing protein [Lentisphaeria bacterium]|nr:KH domain-containing protein [Lentisphaeria bacterium]